MTKIFAQLVGVPGVGKSEIVDTLKDRCVSVNLADLIKKNVKKSGKRFFEVYDPEKIVPFVDAAYREVLEMEAEWVVVTTHASIRYWPSMDWKSGMPEQLENYRPFAIAMLCAPPSQIGDRRAKDREAMLKKRTHYPKISVHQKKERESAHQMAYRFMCPLALIDNPQGGSNEAAEKVYSFFSDSLETEKYFQG